MLNRHYNPHFKKKIKKKSKSCNQVSKSRNESHEPQCPICSRAFSSKKSLKLHILNEQNGKTTLHLKTRGKQTKKIEDDEIEVIENMQFKSCNQISKSCNQVSKSRKESHEPDIKMDSLKCIKCDHVFLTKEKLESHKVPMSKMTKISTDCCKGVTFQNMCDLYFHEKDSHDDDLSRSRNVSIRTQNAEKISRPARL